VRFERVAGYFERGAALFEPGNVVAANNLGQLHAGLATGFGGRVNPLRSFRAYKRAVEVGRALIARGLDLSRPHIGFRRPRARACSAPCTTPRSTTTTARTRLARATCAPRSRCCARPRAAATQVLSSSSASSSTQLKLGKQLYAPTEARDFDGAEGALRLSAAQTAYLAAYCAEAQLAARCGSTRP
jgi:hypothetical protein